MPFKTIPIKAAMHKNIPTIRTVSHLNGVGRLQNKVDHRDVRFSSMIKE